MCEQRITRVERAEPAEQSEGPLREVMNTLIEAVYETQRVEELLINQVYKVMGPYEGEEGERAKEVTEPCPDLGSIIEQLKLATIRLQIAIARINAEAQRLC